jgi:Pentapeptide repeats (8 copies)
MQHTNQEKKRREKTKQCLNGDFFPGKEKKTKDEQKIYFSCLSPFTYLKGTARKAENVANRKQLVQLKSNKEKWNEWREKHLGEEVDLSGAKLSGANLTGQDLSNKNLSGANLTKALLIETDFTNAILSDCIVYGIAAWNVKLEHTTQKNLVITQKHEATITIDNLKVAQFIYLMLNNKEIRDVIDTLTTKSVLILGRFTPERKAPLEALREALRDHNYLPILFDFEEPKDRNLTETVRTLAHLARFIIADLTEPSSIPQELQAIVPTLTIPVQPILLEEKKREYIMFRDFHMYHWVLPTYLYKNQTDLLTTIEASIIQPAEQKAKELEQFHKENAMKM